MKLSSLIHKNIIAALKLVPCQLVQFDDTTMQMIRDHYGIFLTIPEIDGFTHEVSK